MFEKFQLKRFRFTYLALSSFLLSFYILCEGKFRISALLFILGIGAIIIEHFKKDENI